MAPQLQAAHDWALAEIDAQAGRERMKYITVVPDQPKVHDGMT